MSSEVEVYNEVFRKLMQKIKEAEVGELLNDYLLGFIDIDSEGFIEITSFATLLYNLGETLAGKIKSPGGADYTTTFVETRLIATGHSEVNIALLPDEVKLLKVIAEIEKSLVQDGIYSEGYISDAWEF